MMRAGADRAAASSAAPLMKSVRRAEAAASAPLLFCFQLFTSDEVPLLLSQLDASVLSTGCDNWRLYSNVSYDPQISTHLSCSKCVEKAVNGSLSVAHGGEWETALNTPIFIQVWRHVFSTALYALCDWTIKLDVDVVLLPARLRTYLALFDATTPLVGYNAHNGEWLHGPIEAVSRPAVAAYAADPTACERGFNWRTIGEDYYLDRCLVGTLGVQPANMPLLLASETGASPAPPCDTTCSVAYHPYKLSTSWSECFDAARARAARVEYEAGGALDSCGDGLRVGSSLLYAALVVFAVGLALCIVRRRAPHWLPSCFCCERLAAWLRARGGDGTPGKTERSPLTGSAASAAKEREAEPSCASHVGGRTSSTC